MKFEWKPEYNLNIKIIDYQHQQFVKLVNTLAPEIDTVHTNPKVIDEVFLQIDNYIHLHFRLEEKYFEQFHYEQAAEHIQEHHRFALDIEKIKTKLKNGENMAKFDLIDYLTSWLIHHIYTVDKKYVECFHQHGLK